MMMRRTVVSALSTLLATASLTFSAYAQSSTALTYQGFLRDNGQPANGVYDLRFALYDSPSGGNQIGSVVFVEDVTVADGLFTVEVDFGTAPFNTGARRWIEIGVRPGNSQGGHSLLTPRIELTPVPYAIYAQNVANNAVSANQLANDPDSLSKVSGGALSIENGHLKRANNVYFWAQKLKTFGNAPYDRLYLVPSNLQGQANRAYGLAIEPSSALSQGIQYDYMGGEEGGVFTIPVSGFYAIHFASIVETTSSQWGGQAALQLKRGQGNWQNIAHQNNFVRAGSTPTNSLSGTFYLKAGDKIRIVGISQDGTLPQAPASALNNYPQTLTIYLLSAADPPSN
jgi:hypothetical protein